MHRRTQAPTNPSTYTRANVKRASKSNPGRRQAVRRLKLVKWIGGLAAGALLVYGLSQLSFVAYGESDLAGVDFSSLSRSEKRTVLEAANRTRCTCGCALTLAKCVVTDTTCPLREGNIVKINAMVEQARVPRP